MHFFSAVYHPQEELFAVVGTNSIDPLGRVVLWHDVRDVIPRVAIQTLLQALLIQVVA